MFRPLKLLFLIIFINSYSYASSEYGWVQDVVGIDENALIMSKALILIWNYTLKTYFLIL